MMILYKQGCDILFAFEDDIGSALRIMQSKDCDEEAITLSKAAKIVRRDMMQTGFHFNGEFQANIQKDSISSSLLCLVSMILRGSNIEMNLQNVQETQTALTLSQLLMYNSTFRRANASRQSSTINHVRSRETRLPIHMGMLIHAKTRKKGLIDKFSE